MRDKILRGIKDPHAAVYYFRSKLSQAIASRFKKETFVGVSENRSESEYGDYVSFVAKAAQDSDVFAKFKSHRSYRAVLEHVTPEQGREYLAVIREQSPEFLDRFDRFKINDLIGTPIAHSYSGIGTFSPTTLRYIKVASDLKKYFGSDIGQRIAEIGVGYGGQLLINDQVFTVKEHHLYDLPPVLDLVERYLEAHILNCAYKKMTLNQNSGDERYDLAISNYAFSELPSQLQCKYIEKILMKSSRGYLTMNSGRPGSAFVGDKLSIDDLRLRMLPFEVFEETPLTAANNYIIVWGHK
jgi:putative sugar O-methyltransferase